VNYSFIFRHRGFLKLWLAQMLSATAQHLINFALIIKVFDLAKASGNSNVSVGLLVLSYGIPSILFASVAGVYVDHWNKRTVMLVANALRAVLVLGFLFWAHSLVEIFALSFIIATATQFFTPAEAASIPLLVPKKNLCPELLCYLRNRLFLSRSHHQIRREYGPFLSGGYHVWYGCPAVTLATKPEAS
jgi:predicted MFS family arabinose efflux permease